MTDRLPAVEPDVRDLLAAVRNLVERIRGDTLRLSVQPTEAERGLYALAVLESLFPAGLESIVVAHDALGTALNFARPEAEPVISMSTEKPAC